MEIYITTDESSQVFQKWGSAKCRCLERGISNVKADYRCIKCAMQSIYLYQRFTTVATLWLSSFSSSSKLYTYKCLSLLARDTTSFESYDPTLDGKDNDDPSHQKSD